MRRLTWRPFAIGLLVGAISGVIGLRPADAVLVGLVTFVVALAAVSLGSGQEHPWPQAQAEEADGTRREISSLTWSFLGRDGRVAEPAVRRLRIVAATRLARRGVVLPGGITHRPVGRAPGAGSDAGASADGKAHHEEDDAQRRARELLGERAWATLTGPGGWLPSLPDIAQCLDAIEDLVPDGPAPARRGRRRVSRLVARRPGAAAPRVAGAADTPAETQPTGPVPTGHDPGPADPSQPGPPQRSERPTP